ncbi:MAG TPA: hypothetical protein VMB47_11370 [Candidatus Aquilonibacter sp.]|nr:hypothetical protein [Candidatus Aquilonibacter sp.]
MPVTLPELDKYEPRHPNSNDWTWNTFREHEEQLDREAAQKFADLHGPDGDRTVYLSKTNSELLQGWIRERGGRISLKNLELAARELADKLEKRPEPPQEPPAPVDRGIKRVGEVTFVRDAISAEDRAEFRDDPHQSDADRKKAFRELRQAAIAERYARRPESRQAMPIGQARATVAKQYPEYAINSVEYKAAVANLMRGEE